MAYQSVCPKCGKANDFELKRETVHNCNNYIDIIRCRSCGTVVSALDGREMLLIEKIAQKLGIS